MKRELALVFIMAGALLSLSACASVPCQVSVDASYLNRVVYVAVGGSLTVTLESNPTTGFRWSESAEISDQTMLEQVGHKFVSPETTLVGAPGEEVWTFKALKKGKPTISMEYRRPWEEGVEPADTFVLRVVVR